MRRSFKIFSAIAMIIIFCVFLAGCGNSDVKPDKDVENEVTEEADSDILPEDFSTPTPIPNPSGDPPKSYEASHEIIDADFSSGIIQIGNDIFQVGGYMTVNEFLDQYNGKYISATENIHNTNATMSGGGRGYEVFFSNDGWLRFVVEYENLETYYTCTVGEAVINNINVINTNEFTRQNTWFPGGFRADGYGESVNSIEEHLENSDIEYVETEVRNDMIIYPPADEYYRKDTFVYTKVGDQGFEVCARAKESNLHRFNYYFKYVFSCNEDTGELEDVRLQLTKYSDY